MKRRYSRLFRMKNGIIDAGKNPSNLQKPCIWSIKMYEKKTKQVIMVLNNTKTIEGDHMKKIIGVIYFQQPLIMLPSGETRADRPPKKRHGIGSWPSL